MKNIFLFVLFSSFVAKQSFSQQNKIDSLYSTLKTAKEDTNKVNTLLLLGWELIKTSDGYTKAIGYNYQANTLAVRLKYKKGISLSSYLTRLQNQQKQKINDIQDGISKKLSVNIPAYDEKLFITDKDKAIIKDIKIEVFLFVNDSDQNCPVYNSPYKIKEKLQSTTYIIGRDFVPVLLYLGSVQQGDFYLKYQTAYVIKLTNPAYYSWQIMLFTNIPQKINRNHYPPLYGIDAKLHPYKSGNIDEELEKIERKAYYSETEYRFRKDETRILAISVDTSQSTIKSKLSFVNNKNRAKIKENKNYNKNSESHNVVRMSSGVSAQLTSTNDTINRIDLENMKQGPWTYFGKDVQDTNYLPDAKYFEGSYEKNTRTGEWVKYFPNSDTSATMNFDKNLFSGNFRFFHPNGKLQEQGLWNFKLNKLNGKYKEYFNNESLHKEYQYAGDGTKNGLQFVYYINGNAAIIAAMSKDTLHGYVNYYSEDGAMYLQQQYKMGILISEKYFGEKNKFPLKLKEAFKDLMVNNDSIIEQRLKKNLFELSKLDSNYRLLLEQREEDLKNANLLLTDKEKKLLLAQKDLSRSELENELKSQEIILQKIFTISSMAVLILVSVLLFFVIKSNNQRKKANLLLANQKAIIETKNHEITDSINYAKRIQQSILPPFNSVLASLPYSFILFKPKDIVSGDFYWFEESNNKILIAACDCTGHGVPGAIMSMLGADKLNEALVQSSDVSSILTLVNKGVKKALRQSTKEDSTRDGMDMALCAFSKDMRSLEYSGANRSLWIIRNTKNEIEETKATKSAIGGLTSDEQVFSKHTISLNKGDTVYISSDGFADQFSQNNKKLMTKKFKEILLSIQDKKMGEQQNYLETFINNWKGSMEQTDDILVIGIRV